MEIMIKKRDGHFEPLSVEKTKRMIAFACLGLDSCDPLELELDAKLQFVDGMTTKEIQKTLVQTAIEKVISKKDDGFGNQVNKMNQDWQFVAARLFLFDLYKEAAITRRYKAFGYGNFPNLVHMLVEEKKYANFFVTEYTPDELQELGDYIKPKRDYLFNYEGLKLLADRYLVKGFNKEIFELPQERFMAIAMHLALVEGKNKVEYAKKFYDLMSQLKMTTATPTLANAGTPFHQLSSCFISGVDDNLWSIYDVNSKFSRVSKHGGALGIYLGKVRALNSDIRGFKNSSGGVIPWIRLYNDTAVAVDQLGKRKGGATVTLDIWHKDFYEFVELRTNNGDDRRKAHDIFPAISVPNIFMERMLARENFTLFDPHEILAVKGYALEDFYDTDDNKEFTKRYLECEQDPNLHGIEVPALDMMKKIMRSAVETGTPFIFFRDTVNAANPNKHAGMIYASNLCHEIAQNVGFTNLVDSRGDLRADRSHELFLLLLDLFLHHLIAILRARLHLLELLLTALLDDVGHRGFFLLISFELHLQLILHTLDLRVVLLSEILDLRGSSLDIGQGFHDGGGVDDPDLLLSVSRECQREHQEEGNEELLHCLGLLRLIS